MQQIRKISGKFCCLLYLLFAVSFYASGQPPDIYYTTGRYVYAAGGAIAPFAPSHRAGGGTVPALEYGNVTTFAGSVLGFSDGSLRSAKFNHPTGVATDQLGNIYVADCFNHCIRKISTDGSVRTIAGDGGRGLLNGKGGAARFNQPFSLFVDRANGNIYVADSENNQIRKIDPAGNVTLFAGNPAGRADVTNGNGPDAKFNLPESIAMDPLGNLFITDTDNSLIRKISSGADVSTFAGAYTVNPPFYRDGQGADARFNKPVSVARDKEGNFYVTDYLNDRIRMITPDGLVSTYAGNGVRGTQNGPRLSASFDHPTALAIDPVGNIYVSDNNHIIRRISKTTGLVSTIAGSGQRGDADGLRWEASFFQPIGLAFNGDVELFVADENNDRIRKIILGGGYDIDKPLPAGLLFDPRTGTISGTPTESSPATDYTITAHNDFGESSAVVNIEVTDPNLVFGPIPAKQVCDADFDPGARAGAPVTYTSSDPAVATIVNGKIHITRAGSVLISASNGASVLSQTLTVNELPKPVVAINVGTAAACEGAELSYTLTLSGEGASPLYQWFVNGQDSGNDGPVFSSSMLKKGDLVSCVVTNNDFCVPVRSEPADAVQVNYSPYRDIAVSILSSANGAFCPGSPVTLTAVLSSDADLTVSYQWKINGNATGVTGQIFTTTSLNNGDVVSCVAALSGSCIVNPVAVADFFAAVLDKDICNIVIPNAFSPNGDGRNDTWDLSSLAGQPISSIAVYNRYGQLVFHSYGEQVAWDGTAKGRPLPAGTYYYLIGLSTERRRLSGTVTLIR